MDKDPRAYLVNTLLMHKYTLWFMEDDGSLQFLKVGEDPRTKAAFSELVIVGPDSIRFAASGDRACEIPIGHADCCMADESCTILDDRTMRGWKLGVGPWVWGQMYTGGRP